MATDPNATPPLVTPNPAAAPNPDSTPAPPDVDNAGNQPSATGVLPGSNGAGGPSVGAPSQPPAPAAGSDMSGTQHQSTIGKIFQTIAGGKTTDFARTPNGPVAVKRDLKPGEMARNILGAAFSLLAAGAGGAMMGNEKRGPYEQPEDETIGGQERGRVQQRQQEAQKEFNNEQTENEAVLRAHKDAMEQQTAIAQIQKDADEHRQSEFNYAQGVKTSQQADIDRFTKQAMTYDQAMAMPGSEIMKDAKGAEINFYDSGTPGQPGYKSAGQKAQEYAVAHPETIHGSTNGNTKYGVLPVFNPYTGALQFVDYPADRHDVGIANFGQKMDANGEPMTNPDGSPVPDGTVLDPKTKKPTVLTQTVTPQQAQDIRKQNITMADQQSQILDRTKQADKYESEAKKNEVLSDAQEVYANGGIEKMTQQQRQVLARATFQQQTLMSNREKIAQEALTNAEQHSDPNDPDVKKAQANYDAAKNDYDDATNLYDQLTGNTPGIQIANRIVRTGALNSVKTPADWAKIDQQITSAGLPDAELQKARAKAWNAMSPAQQAAATGKAAAPAAAGATPVGQAAPAARATIFDPQGNPHNVPANLVDQYLASPNYSGWHK